MEEEENKNIFMKDGKMYRNKVDIGGNVTGVEEIENPTEEDFEELEAAIAEEEAEAAAKLAAEAAEETAGEPESQEMNEGEIPEPLSTAEPEVAEAPTEEVAEAPTEEVEAEAPTEEVAEAPTEEVEAEAPTEEVEAEAPTEEVEAEAPTEEVEAEAPTEEVEAEAPTEEVAEAPTEEVEAAEAPTEEVEAEEETVAELEEEDSIQSESSYYMEEVKKPIRKKNSLTRFIAATLIVSVAGGASMGAGYAYVKYSVDTPETVTKVPAVAQPVVSQTATSTSTQALAQAYSAIDVIKAVKPTVVSISTQTVGQAQYFGSFTVPYETKSAGSGVVFYSDDDRVAIATNNHVIDGTTEIFVTFDEDITVPAKVVGTKSDSDLAVIVVDWNDLEEQGMYNVSVAVFGDSDSLEVGSTVYAIGNAMGEGISATDGIISMTEQTIIIDESKLSVLQTSAAINGGNSGGALVNTAGEVIGINTAKYNPMQAEGMGYAIPSNEFVPIIEDLLQNGTMPKPYIGVTGTSVTADNAALYRLPVGALIMEVVEGGPADVAGIMVGDIVTQVNGKTVMGMETLITVVNDLEVGSAVDIHVVRDTTESVDLTLVVGDKNS